MPASDLALDLATALDPVVLARAAGLDPDQWQTDLLRILGRTDGDTATLTKAELIAAVAAEVGIPKRDARS